jgi:hypothetical protein
MGMKPECVAPWLFCYNGGGGGERVKPVYVALVVCSLALAACEKPGEGAKAEAGYRHCGLIIAALARYHAQADRYPATLDELVPTYLDKLPAAPAGIELAYGATQSGAGFDLTFKYAGPGMNICTYTPRDAWRCHGYY